MKKPFLFALVATVYIIFIVLAIQTMGSIHQKDNILMPMAGLALFVLSAAVMGFLFLSEPLRLFLENEKKDAVIFFAKTVGFFACFVAIFVILIFIL